MGVKTLALHCNRRARTHRSCCGRGLGRDRNEGFVEGDDGRGKSIVQGYDLVGGGGVDSRDEKADREDDGRVHCKGITAWF